MEIFLKQILWAVVSFVFTALIIRFFPNSYLSKIRDDRWHKVPVPNLGGIAIFITYFLYLLIFNSLNYKCIFPFFIIFFMGIIDDLFEIDYRAKLLTQFFAAMIIVSFGYHISIFELANLNYYFSVLWIVFFVNAFNFSDNMDGLACILSINSLMLFFYLFGSFNDIILCAIILGFAVWNIYPAQIFMGNCGSMFLGLYLSTAVLRYNPDLKTFLITLLLVIIPIMDTVFVFILRFSEGRYLLVGGKDHISHNLSRYYLSDTRAILVLWFFASIFGVLGLTYLK